MDIFSEPIVLSIIGGLLYQLFPIIENAKKNRKSKPDQFNWRLLFILPFYCLLAGIIGYVYFEGIEEVNKVMALHVGASAPLILRALGSSLP